MHQKTVFGTYATFMIFAIVTLTLKGLGERIGVGVNFQNPYFFYDRDLLYRQYVGVFEVSPPSWAQNYRSFH